MDTRRDGRLRCPLLMKRPTRRTEQTPGQPSSAVAQRPAHDRPTAAPVAVVSPASARG
jgi:hypothetical protein